MKNVILMPITATRWVTILSVYLVWKTVFPLRKPVKQSYMKQSTREVNWFSL